MVSHGRLYSSTGIGDNAAHIYGTLAVNRNDEIDGVFGVWIRAEPCGRFVGRDGSGVDMDSLVTTTSAVC